MFRVYRSLGEIGPDAPPSAINIGNFDGVHAGHRQLLTRNLQLSRERGLIPSVLTFDPHPTTVVAPDRAPLLLTTIDDRIALMREAGIQQVFVVPFDRRFSELGPEEFIRAVVHDSMNARLVLVGDNFRFGHGQAGDVNTLRSLGERYGFDVEIVKGVSWRGRFVSSSTVRNLITAGDVSLACRLLKRPYALSGDVVRGHGIGSKQTVPTLNLSTKAELLPANGVYVTRTRDLDDEREWPSITNIGMRPTFDGDALTIETFLLDKLEGDTPSKIRVSFLRRIREERRFPSPEELKKQILQDAGRAIAFHRRMARVLRSR